jgi:hypothetical protein
MRKSSVTIPLLGAAIMTAGALLVQFTRKPEPRPIAKVQAKATPTAEKAFLERLRERGL